MNKSTKIIISVAVCVLVGFLSGFATQSSVKTWFLTIEKPFFNPPSWVFAPVWTLLYIMMGIAFGLVWSSDFKDKKAVKTAMVVFGIQLIMFWAQFKYGNESRLNFQFHYKFWKIQ